MKRVIDVVRIFERVTREVDAVLLMVGDGPERAAAQALAPAAGPAGPGALPRHAARIEEIVGLADVFLLPSELESFGLSALEAMACGVPVVGSDAGGLPEVVHHAETGFLLPVGDVEGMAARTIEILKDDERRREMGQAGRRRAESLFGAERVVAQYEAVYERPGAGELTWTPSTSRLLRAPGRRRVDDGRDARPRGGAGAAGRPRGPHPRGVRQPGDTRDPGGGGAGAARILGVSHRESLGLPDARLQ